MAHDTQWTDHLIRKSVEKLAPYAASAETRSTRKALTKLETKELIEAAASIEHAIKLTTSIPPPLALDLSLPKLLFQTVVLVLKLMQHSEAAGQKMAHCAERLLSAATTVAWQDQPALALHNAKAAIQAQLPAALPAALWEAVLYTTEEDEALAAALEEGRPVPEQYRTGKPMPDGLDYAAGLARFCAGLARSWPGSFLASTQAGPVAVPAVQLILAAVKLSLRLFLVNEELAEAVLPWLLSPGVMIAQLPTTGLAQDAPAQQQLLAEPALAELQLLLLALMVKLHHQQQQVQQQAGRGHRRQQQVAPLDEDRHQYLLQLLVALGVDQQVAASPLPSSAFDLSLLSSKIISMCQRFTWSTVCVRDALLQGEQLQHRQLWSDRQGNGGDADSSRRDSGDADSSTSEDWQFLQMMQPAALMLLEFALNTMQKAGENPSGDAMELVGLAVKAAQRAGSCWRVSSDYSCGAGSSSGAVSKAAAQHNGVKLPTTAASGAGSEQQLPVGELMQLVRKLMPLTLAGEAEEQPPEHQQKQQQQQQQAEQGSGQQAANSSDQAEQQHQDMLVNLIGLLHLSTVLNRSKHMDAAWQSMAKPMAATLEHTLLVRIANQWGTLAAPAAAAGSTESHEEYMFWQAVDSMLWSHDGGFNEPGPLVMVVHEEAAAAAAAAGPANHAAAAIGPAALQLFSLCISCMKVLGRQQGEPHTQLPKRETAPDEFSRAAAMDRMQSAVMLLLSSSRGRGNGNADSGSSLCSVGSCMEAIAPWLVVLLRILQLRLHWLQQYADGLVAAADSSSELQQRLTGQTSGADQQWQLQGWTPGADQPQQAQARLVACWGNLQHTQCALQGLSSVLDELCAPQLSTAATPCAASAAAAAQQHAITAAVLQGCRQQLRQDVLPAIQQVLKLGEQIKGHGSNSSNSSMDVADASGSPAVSAAAQTGAQCSSGSSSCSDGSCHAGCQHERQEQAPAETCTTVTDQQRGDAGQEQYSSSAIRQYVAALQQLLAGGALQSWLDMAAGALPLRWCCNNPRCNTLGTGDSRSRASELKRARARKSRCPYCGAAAYCSLECSAAHWCQHKTVCKLLKRHRQEAQQEQQEGQ